MGQMIFRNANLSTNRIIRNFFHRSKCTCVQSRLKATGQTHRSVPYLLPKRQGHENMQYVIMHFEIQLSFLLSQIRTHDDVVSVVTTEKSCKYKLANFSSFTFVHILFFDTFPAPTKGQVS